MARRDDAAIKMYIYSRRSTMASRTDWESDHSIIVFVAVLLKQTMRYFRYILGPSKIDIYISEHYNK